MLLLKRGRRPRSSTTRRITTGIIAFAATGGLLLSGVGTAVADPLTEAVDQSVLEPMDPQHWVKSEDMTWDDYVEIPGTEWAKQTTGSKRVFNGAIVLLDFQNQDFLVSQTEGSHVFGNPSGLANQIPRDEVPNFYKNLLNTPNALNHGRTINEYYMEQTGGRLSVNMDAFGPFKLPGNIEEYGLNDSFNKTGGSNATLCPQGMTCNKNIRTDALAAWAAASGIADPLTEFDQVFWVTAGHDESGTWEEFGPQIFATPEDVTDDFGPPRDAEGKAFDQNGNEMKNWAKTRYVPWTSWASASNHWPNANFPVKDGNGNVIRAGNSTQAESSGMAVFAHEFAHILEIGDNYGNPYGTDAADGGAFRDTSGPFDVLARGAFNGPGGTHTRWNVPAVAGASQPSGLALRNRIKLDMIDESSIVRLNRSALKDAGSITVDLQSRALQEDGVPLGINLELDGGDKSTGTCTRVGKFDCDGGNYDNYTLEVIDRMGTDSFQPDNGVMIAKTKNRDSNPFIWTVDANPQDINMIDYVRADGTPVPVTRGDQRQLNDALFHAGVNSGSAFEHVDELNRLHFYVVKNKRDARGILHYGVAVRSLDGAGSQARDVTLGTVGQTGSATDGLVALTVPVTNSGEAVTDERANSDIYRVSTTVSGGDGSWSAQTPSEIVTAKSGEKFDLPVYVSRGSSGHSSGGKVTVTVTVTSENDPNATQTITYELADAPKPAPQEAPVITSKAPAAGIVGSAYTHQVTATGIPAPTLSISGSLPAGLKFDAKNGRITGTPTKAGTFAFSFLASNKVKTAVQKVTLVIRAAAAKCESPRSVAVFKDVPLSHKFYKNIDWMHCTGLTTGYSDKTFRPKENLSREAMAAFMYRLQAPSDFKAPKVSPFKDVPTSHKFYKEIAWMKASGLSKGYADGTYRPSEVLSRDAMAAFMFRLETKKSASFAAPKSSPFTDVATSHKFYREIAWMKQEKLSTGYSDGSYRPADTLSREAMAAFVYRLVKDYRK